ncbi:MAG: DEAD/DEAH box helicase [Acidobacteria bacterium]|nr:DEAD/DEAH box helicase [Acidobacteriota bacterium]
MQLSSALAPLANPGTRARGADYARSGAIVHFDPAPTFVYAVVRGGDDYVVRLDLAGRDVRGSCSCPYFADHLELCKHLWAVVLECDRKNLLQLPDTIRPTSVRFLPSNLGEELPDEWAHDDPEFVVPRGSAASTRGGARDAGWRKALADIASRAQATAEDERPSKGRLLYILDPTTAQRTQTIVITVMTQPLKQNGEWGVMRTANTGSTRESMMDDSDRLILGRLHGAASFPGWGWQVNAVFQLKGVTTRDILPLICGTNRCFVDFADVPATQGEDQSSRHVTWDADTPFHARLHISRDPKGTHYIVGVNLERGESSLPLADISVLRPAEGIALAGTRVIALAQTGALAWALQVRDNGPLRIPVGERDALREALLASGAADDADVPDELRTTVVEVDPVPHLTLRAPQPDARALDAEVRFSYAGGPLQPHARTPLVATATPQVVAKRAVETERRAVDRLYSVGAKRTVDHWERRQRVVVSAADVPRVVRTLIDEGWQVEADGRRYRLAGSIPELAVRSGLDWFELRGDATFGGESVALPRLLEAIQKRSSTVLLGDGSYGLLPEDWVRQFAPLALGKTEDDHVRFTRSQVAILDALLASRPAVSWDEKAAAVRERLRAVTTIAPLDPPATFTGTLRKYQREALGWMRFLRDFDFGGCLADDMGLGKTVVVLALLDARRAERERDGLPQQPSLVVVPRSVLFNWQQEAARFAPKLRVLDFSGAGRAEQHSRIAESDVVLSTYGTLRRDAAALADVEFDYVVLDEAQTIKNANTAAAKAARLLRGRHRLALSGTPVENRIADLWSIFEFLNPGLLSGATAFGRSFANDAESDELRLLGQALRPFILRRTKEQVATELPPKVEQTLVCDLERQQRSLYNELRDHYRRTLLGRASNWQRSKLQVLEALLRLRQAACHPGLVDPKRVDVPSAKLDILVPRLLEAIDEGHKALVFSQFTSFLSLLRDRLDEDGVSYEYLDGKTKDREGRVHHFQTDPDCRLFLISLKAGGVGLNLTAADYVFILDPWWNPAAEAQAVDRTHRIGQTKHVFAYRLIAKDTVEERVLELQARKKELADAIITADNSVVRSLKREDLELLLS